MNTNEPTAVDSLTFRRRPLFTSFIWLLLAAGSILFLLPFLWLVSTSIKTPRELFMRSSGLIPLAPGVRNTSPYIDTAHYTPPADKRLAARLPAVEKIIRELSYPLPDYLDRTIVERELAEGLLSRMIASLPAEELTRADTDFVDHVRRSGTKVVLDDLFQNVYRRFQISRLMIGSQDVEVQELGEGTSISQRLTNLTPQVTTLTDVNDMGACVALALYDFSKGEAIVLEQTFKTSFDLHNLRRVQLAVRPDDSWQRLYLSIEKLGARFEPVRPVYLSGLDWITLVWQEPGPDDDSNRIKVWTHLTQREAGPQFVSDPHTIKITVRVQRTSLLNAWWGKIKANYLSAAQYVPFVRYFWNSTYLITLNVILLLLSSSLVAFGISRFAWPGRDLVFLLILGTMMLPEQVTMVPTFLVWKNLGLYNTLVPLWLGSAFGSAVNIFLLRQFMKGIPRDVEDAARIDGCGFLRVYWHIMLPLVRPALAAIGLLTAVAIWNDFKGPLLYLADQRLYPLSFGLYAFTITVSSSPAQTMAASVLTALPIITLFFFAQRHFIRGVTLTGVRG